MNQENQSNTSPHLVDRLNDVIRDNPLAAGLIGAGVAWMIFGTKGISTIGEFTKSAGMTAATAISGAGSMVKNAGSASIDAGSDITSSVKNAVSRAADGMLSAVPDYQSINPSAASRAVIDAGITAGEHFQAITNSGRQYTSAIQSQLSESLEKQPLLLGVIGLAIGAGLASTFAATAMESELMGEQAARTKETVKDIVEQAQDRSRQVISDVQAEAKAQGLTLDAAKDASASVANKIGNVAAAARDTVSQPFK